MHCFAISIAPWAEEKGAWQGKAWGEAAMRRFRIGKEPGIFPPKAEMGCCRYENGGSGDSKPLPAPVPTILWATRVQATKPG